MNPFDAVVRGEKSRKEFGFLLNRHRAAISIQKRIRARSYSKKFNILKEASISIQSGNHNLYLPGDR